VASKLTSTITVAWQPARLELLNEQTEAVKVHGRSHLEQFLLLHLARVLLSSDFSEHVPDIRIDKSARTLDTGDE
jgi:hypothetical protein